VTWFDQRFALSTLTWCIWYRRNHVVMQGTALWAWAMTQCVYWNVRILKFLCWWSLNDLFSELVCGSMTKCVYWNFRILTFLCWWFLNDLFSEVAYCFLNSRFRANHYMFKFPYKPITNTAWVRARLCKLQKGCTRLEAQVIKFTSCLPMVGGSLQVLRLLPPIKLVTAS
jgi:hypothetical protein